VTIGVIALAAFALFTLGPRFLRHGLSAIFVLSNSVEAAAPYRIDVSPGNASVPRGVDRRSPRRSLVSMPIRRR